jgi:hypothetical protein
MLKDGKGFSAHSERLGGKLGERLGLGRRELYEVERRVGMEEKKDLAEVQGFLRRPDPDPTFPEADLPFPGEGKSTIPVEDMAVVKEATSVPVGQRRRGRPGIGEPWKAEGVSRRTWYLRRARARGGKDGCGV